MSSPQATVPIVPPSALLRLDQKSGTLKAREYKVTITAGPDAGKTVKIDGICVVGSHPDAGLPLTDPTVSRYHVELHARGDGVSVRDLDSTNGTFISGARIQTVIVEEEATITVGKTSFRIATVEQDLGLPEPQSSFGKVIGASSAMRT